MLRFVTVMAVLVLPLLSGVIRASAQEHSYRVVATYGDTREVTCLQRDGEVSWVGSLGGGVVRAAGGERERLDTTRGLPGMRVHDCALHEHTLWVATEGGLARWDAASEHFELLARGRFAHVVSCGAREVLSVDAHGRVQRWTGAVATELLHGELVPSALACSADGAHWALGTLSGEVVQDGRPAQRQPAANGGGHVEPVEALRFEHGTRETLIVQTTDHVVRVDLAGRVVGEGLPPVRQPKLASRTSPLELGTSTPCGERISALTVHRDALWIGSFDRGLCRYDGTTFTHFGGPSVLPSDMVNDLASDGERLYVATARGLAVLEADGTFHSYVHSDCVDQLANACPWYPAVNGVAVDAKLGTAWVADLGALHRVTRASDGAARWKHRADSSFGTRSFTRIAARDGRVAAGSGDLLGAEAQFRRALELRPSAEIVDPHGQEVAAL
ncbi:MAG TPA: hypothetical protein VHM19_00605, partial [Polyangiales bacterium]|nr:hypothetical protein [Polyangiales bacterium]